MIEATRLKDIFADGIELDTSTAHRKLREIFRAGEAELAVYFENLSKEGILTKSVAFLDPSNYGELIRFMDEKLIETFRLSKNRLKNKTTGCEYDIDSCIRVTYYRLANPDYVYSGVEKIASHELMNALIFGCDTVSFSKEDTDDQVAIYRLLTDLISDTLNKLNIAPGHIVCIPTGDGYFVIMNASDPYKVIDFAHELSLEIARRKYAIPLRCGIHSGSVYVLKHKNGRLNVIGHSMNKCARIMSFGNKGHILVSDEYYKSFVDHSANKHSFREIDKQFTDKHGYPYRLYTYCKDSVGNPELPVKEEHNA